MDIPFLTSEEKCDHEKVETVKNGAPVTSVSLGADRLTVTMRQTYVNKCTNPDCDYVRPGVDSDGEWPCVGELMAQYHIPRDDLDEYEKDGN